MGCAGVCADSDCMEKREEDFPAPGAIGFGGSCVSNGSAQFLRAQLLSGTDVGEPLGNGGGHHRLALGRVRSYFPAPTWESRWVTVGSTIGLLLAALPVAFQLRRKDSMIDETGLVQLLKNLARRPEQIFFLIEIGRASC